MAGASGEAEGAAGGGVDPADVEQETRARQEVDLAGESGSLFQGGVDSPLEEEEESSEGNQDLRESLVFREEGENESEERSGTGSTANFRVEDGPSADDLLEGPENGGGVSSEGSTERDPGSSREGVEDSSGKMKQGDVIDKVRINVAVADAHLLGYVEGTDAQTILHLADESNSGVERQHDIDQFVNEIEGSHLNVESIGQEREGLIAEVEELKAQAYEREKLLSTAESSVMDVDRLKNELVLIHQQAKHEVEERSNLAVQLQSALEQLQDCAYRESLLTLKLIRSDEEKQTSTHIADILQLQQQLHEMADEKTSLAMRVDTISRTLEQLNEEKAQLKVEVDDLMQGKLEREEELLQELQILNEHAQALQCANNESNFVIEDLKQDLQRMEEESQVLKNASDESSQSLRTLMVQHSCLIDEVGKLKLDKDTSDYNYFELVAELEILSDILQSVGESHARLTAEAAALKYGKDDEIRILTTQIMDLERELHDLREAHANVVSKSKVLDDEKIQLKSHVDFMLEDRQKREEEVVSLVETWQERTQTMEVEKVKLFSSLKDANTKVLRIENEKAALVTRLDDLSQTLQDAVSEKEQLANEVYRLEQERQSAEERFTELTFDLQMRQEHLMASNERQQLLISELRQTKDERDEENEKHSKRMQEVQVELQGLREENTHVVMKASKLDQLVEELETKKLQLGNDLERLVHERERREQELEVELGTWREHVQSLEVEKLEKVTMIDTLNTQARRLGEDNKKLMGLSNEASQSLHQLWEENTRLIAEVNKLEHEKQAQEGEKMELVAGLQTVWEQLQAANDREAALASEFRGLSDRRNDEEVMFNEKLRELEQKVQTIIDEKTDLGSKSLETSQILEELRQETSEMLKELREEKVQLVKEVAELMTSKQETEEMTAQEVSTWKTHVQVLESEKAVSLAENADLNQQLQKFREEMKEMVEKDVKSMQLIEELCGESTRLGSEIDKLEEVKERHEGERLELAAELQAAWDQIQAVRESEANLTTELSELKDQRDEEKLSFDELVQDLRLQLQELGEQKLQSGEKIEALTKRLDELRKEQELQDENARLANEIVMLVEEKEKMALERANLTKETQTLKVRVEILELEKNKLTSEIEELNQWLSAPAAEKRQLATKLDELTHLFKSLENEKSQLAAIVCKLEEERERRQEEMGKLNDLNKVLEEQETSLNAANEDLLGQLQCLEEEKKQLVKTLETTRLSVQTLDEKVHSLEKEVKSMVSVHEDSLLRLVSIEEEKIQLGKLLEREGALLKGLQLESANHVDTISNLEQEVEKCQAEVQLLSDEVCSVKEERLSMGTLHQESLCQLEVLEEEKLQGAKSLEESTLLVHKLNDQILILEEDKKTLVRSNQERYSEVQSLDLKNAQLMKLLEESTLLVQGLQADNSKLINTISILERELEKERKEIQALNDLLGGSENEKHSFLCVQKDLSSRINLLEEEKIELAKSLEDSKILMEGLRLHSSQHVHDNSTCEEEMERLSAEVVKLQDQVQSLEEKNKSLLTTQEESFIQWQALELEKVEMAKVIKESNGLAQKLQTDNSVLVSAVRNFEQDEDRRQEEMEALTKLVKSLGDNNDINMVEHKNLLLRLQSAEEENTQMAKELEEANFVVKTLEAENTEHVCVVSKFEEETSRGSEKIEALIVQVRCLEDENKQLVFMQEKLRGQFCSLEEEKMEKLQLKTALEESEVLVMSLQKEADTLKACLSDLVKEKEKLAVDLKMFQKQIYDTSTERNERQNEVHGLREQLQEYKSKVEKSESDANICREEVHELAKQLETYREQIVRLAEERSSYTRQLVEVKQQLEHICTDKDATVKDLEIDLDFHEQPLGQVEEGKSHPEVEISESREKLEQVTLDNGAMATSLCQELDNLLQIVVEQKEKVIVKQRLSHEKTEHLSTLCQEVDLLILRVREERERVVKREKYEMLQSNIVKASVENESQLELDKYKLYLTELIAKNAFVLDLEGPNQKRQSFLERRDDLKKCVARLSSSLEESQNQLHVLVTGGFIENPLFNTQVDGWRDSQHSEQGTRRHDMAPPGCLRVDGKYAMNFERENEAKGCSTAIDRGPESPAWIKKENGTLSSMDLFCQRAPKSARSFKKCKINMQQPKRRWKV